jgi:hypothetical protein
MLVGLALLALPDVLVSAAKASDPPTGQPRRDRAPASTAVPLRFQQLLDDLVQRHDLSDDQFTEVVYLATVTRFPSATEKERARILIDFYRPLIAPDPWLPAETRRLMVADVRSQGRRKAFGILLPLLLRSHESVLREPTTEKE